VKLALRAFAAAVLVGLAAVPTASAAVSSIYGGDLTCAVQAGNGSVRLCGGPTTTWDGTTKVDVNVILPPAPASGADGPYPLIGVFHGWGGHKIGLEDEQNGQVQGWAERGYAVFSMSDRGWGSSCGAMDAERLAPTCAAGYNHLMDDRYEVRDAQFLISILADEGIAQPDEIGATGVSYGGGMAMALAALRNRTMLPDGSLVPWKSPGGTAMELAAAVPQWPWSDLAYSLMPNGSTLDYVADSPYRGPDGTAPIGIEKASYVSGLFATGLASSDYAAPGTDSGADLVTWYSLINSGEPYDSNPLAPPIIDEITAHHSSYYVDHSESPAPLLIQSGWNDDLFPPDEAIRFYNRTRTQYPDSPISLFFMDDGHARSQNKPADVAVFQAREEAWFDHYLKGAGTAPISSAEVLTTTCGTPSEGPYRADSWKDLAPGEIRLDSAAAQTIVPGAGDPSLGGTFDPIANGDPCASASGADQSGVASYRFPAAPADGFNLLGSATIVADLATTGTTSELAARLLDVAPGGSETLVARGLLRPGPGGAKRVFQLHPQAYRFAPGHVAKLELLPSDAPYARPASGQAPITVSNLELRLPVREQAGSLGGIVQPPAPKVVPPGYELASDYRASAAGAAGSGGPSVPRGRAALLRGRILVNRKALLLRLGCAGPGDCDGRLTASAKANGRGKQWKMASGSYALAGNATARIRLPLSRAGRRLVDARRRAQVKSFGLRLEISDSGRAGPLTLRRRVRISAGR
jgi:fermentation-respiration switch protein FrsA (DUF1100 family)